MRVIGQLSCAVCFFFHHFLQVVSYGIPHKGLADLPPLLEFADGTPVLPHEWSKRRDEIKALLSDFFFGTLPETPPSIERATIAVLSQDRGVTRSRVNITFIVPEPVARAFVVVETISPDRCSEATPCPAIFTQTNHRKWGVLAVQRGYVAIIYPGSDVDDQTDAFRCAYPEATWSLIPRRAWLASRVLDWVATVSFIARGQVGILGHSRNGKQSMIAAAFDERFLAVISSSSGAPASSPYRFTSAYTFGEDPRGPWPVPPASLNCSCTRTPISDKPLDDRCCWWLPKLATYAGRENELPIDAHGLHGLIAPRFLLHQGAETDTCDPTFAVERAYLSARPVYEMFGASERLRVAWRPGNHHGFEDLHSYMDWFDFAFNRSASSRFPEVLLHHFDWNAWNASTLFVTPPARSSPLAERVAYLMGYEGEQIGPVWSTVGGYVCEHSGSPSAPQLGDSDYIGYINAMLMRGYGTWQPKDEATGVTRMTVNFGAYIFGNLYHTRPQTPAPAVIYLHPFSYQSGYTEDYPHDSSRLIDSLARNGFVVLAYDQLGFASRQAGGRPQSFYSRKGATSLLANMVLDVTSAVDALYSWNASHWLDGSPPVESMPPIDVRLITVVGYSLGGLVALHASHVDHRIAATVSLNGLPGGCWSSAGISDSGTGGLAQLYEWHALLPRLGWGEPPYTLAELAASGTSHGRRVLVYAPQKDRTANATEIANCFLQHRGEGLTIEQPEGINELDDFAINTTLDFLRDVIMTSKRDAQVSRSWSSSLEEALI